MKIERAPRVESFKSAMWSAMDTLAIGETFEVPFDQLNYAANLVNARNKQGQGKFSVVTVPVFAAGILTGDKTVHVVRIK